ncbi:hypothetical protein [Haloarcula amylovorans]|uniref:hypothetical protein n=1 Tax=Haloarcula amylovorans TaxID=2562280 RepID=UPI001ADDA12C|nr:hypothetical protein [Halomicroarcula amylolytica]
MSEPSRRDVLASLGGSIVITGCSSPSSNEEIPASTGTQRSETPTTTKVQETGTPSSTKIEKLLNEKITISSTIQSQPSSSEPSIIEFTLSNETKTELTILPSGSGQALEKLRNYKYNAGEFEVIPYPVNPEHMGYGPPVSESAEKTDCWRLPADFSQMVEDSVFELSIQADETYSKRHYLFYEGPSDTCLPSHEYEMVTQLGVIRPTGTETEVRLHSQLTISESQQLTANSQFEFYSA